VKTVRITIYLGFFFLTVLIRLCNPDMSETRLLLTFWWVYLLGLIVCFAVTMVPEKREK